MYLTLFNIVSALGWATVLVATLAGIATSQPARHAIALNAFSNQLGSLLLRHVPPTHARSWSVLAPVQSLAALEVVHVLLGRVKSPLPTTFMQVSSRLILIWAIVPRFSSTHASPIYTTMVLAWSLTEVPRYAYYALGVAGIRPPPWLTWLRYSTFYFLYPLGAGSEALLALSTISEWQHGLYAIWSIEDWIKAAMVLIWIPGTSRHVFTLTPLISSRGLYVMYTHMIHTRRKVLGPKKAHKLGAEPKDRAKAN